MTSHPRPSVLSARRSLALAGALACAAAANLAGQGAIDPVAAPRAAQMNRVGERQAATEYLGRYLATAPDDGRAWLQLGRFYLADAADWHARGHTGDPAGDMVLDFAVTALDQAVRLQVDSGAVLRAQADLARALLLTEDSGWGVAQAHATAPAAPVSALIREFGDNLVASCPAGAVIETGSDLETVAVWTALVAADGAADLTPVIPRLYATDARYRASLAATLGVDPSLGIRAAMEQVAEHRAVCATPLADSAAIPAMPLAAVRLARVTGGDSLRHGSYLTFTAFVATARAGRSVWLPEVLRSYAAAARRNPALCGSAFAQVADRPDDVCR
jgi:hypothetical protein